MCIVYCVYINMGTCYGSYNIQKCILECRLILSDNSNGLYIFGAPIYYVYIIIISVIVCNVRSLQICLVDIMKT